MADAYVKSEIRRFIVDNLLSGDERGLEDGTDLQADHILDSFATLELIQFLEESFGIEINTDELAPDSFRNLDTIATLVEKARA